MFTFVKSFLRKFFRRRLHAPDIVRQFTVYGSDYGGWPLVDGSIDESSIVYSFGVGEDVTFDLAIIERFGCNVWAFDPTPRSAQWVAKQNFPSALHFMKIGISDQDGEAAFFPPSDPSHVSYSNRAVTSQGGKPISAPVKQLHTLMKELGHRKIDVLKLDIEGFEYQVIRNVISTQIRPSQLLVEFHHRLHGAAERDTRESVSQLRAAGYRLFHVSASGREYGFVLEHFQTPFEAQHSAHSGMSRPLLNLAGRALPVDRLCGFQVLLKLASGRVLDLMSSQRSSECW